MTDSPEIQADKAIQDAVGTRMGELIDQIKRIADAQALAAAGPNAEHLLHMAAMAESLGQSLVMILDDQSINTFERAKKLRQMADNAIAMGKRLQQQHAQETGQSGE